MANSFMRFTSGGTAFTFTKPFLSTAHLIVEKNGTALTLTDDYTISGVDSYPYTTATITLGSAATTDDVIIIRRTTIVPADIMWKNFSDASVLKADELDDIQRYLVFLSQEADDEADAALTEDFSQNFNAETKRIKNVAAPTATSDAVNKSYVDAQTLYGGSSVTPQNWNKTLAGTSGNFSGNTGNVTCVLDDPVPTGDIDVLFLVSVGGAIQRPTDDYTVAVNDSNQHVITLLNLPSSPSDAVFPATTVVNIRNYGIARNMLSGAIEAGSTSGTSLHVKKISGQTGDLQRWTNENNTGDADATNILAKVAADGDATFVDITATGNGDIDGNLNVDGTLNVKGNTTIGDAEGDSHTINGILACANGLNLTGELQTRSTSSDSYGSAGFIRQVVQGTVPTGGQSLSNYNTSYTTLGPGVATDGNYNGFFVNTGLRLAITPKFTDSYIIVWGQCEVKVQWGGSRAEAEAHMTTGLYLGSTDHSQGVINPDGTLVSGTSAIAGRVHPARQYASNSDGSATYWTGEGGSHDYSGEIVWDTLTFMKVFGPSDHTTALMELDHVAKNYNNQNFGVQGFAYSNQGSMFAVEIK